MHKTRLTQIGRRLLRRVLWFLAGACSLRTGLRSPAAGDSGALIFPRPRCALASRTRRSFALVFRTTFKMLTLHQDLPPAWATSAWVSNSNLGQRGADLTFP